MKPLQNIKLIVNTWEIYSQYNAGKYYIKIQICRIVKRRLLFTEEANQGSLAELGLKHMSILAVT